MERPGVLCWVLAGSVGHPQEQGRVSVGFSPPRCGDLRSALQDAVRALVQLLETSQPLRALQVEAVEGE